MFELCKIKIQELRLYPNDRKDTVGEVQWAAIALGTSSAVRWLHGLLTCDWIGASIVEKFVAYQAGRLPFKPEAYRACNKNINTLNHLGRRLDVYFSNDLEIRIRLYQCDSCALCNEILAT